MKTFNEISNKTSKRELIVRNLLKEKYPNEKVHYNLRPDWLRNPKTGKNLELDIYYPDLKIAIEVQGIHHETLHQQKKDAIKDQECYKRDITLEKVACKSKSLRRLIKKYDLKKIKTKSFGMGTPNKKSKYWNYYKQTKDQIARDRYTRAIEAQKEERRSNLESMRVRGLASSTSGGDPACQSPHFGGNG